ncbi:MAG: HIRAN domain-containing protein [Paracoccaceae bacterium]
MFGFLKRGKKSSENSTQLEMKRGRGFTFEIVGEAKYQSALSKISGGRTEEGVKHFCDAMLIQEPQNRYDNNAVCVEIDRKTVGYLARERAKEFNKAMTRLGFNGRRAKCGAKIVGGWDRGGDDVGYFGVKLNLSWPPKPDS